MLDFYFQIIYCFLLVLTEIKQLFFFLILKKINLIILLILLYLHKYAYLQFLIIYIVEKEYLSFYKIHLENYKLFLQKYYPSLMKWIAHIITNTVRTKRLLTKLFLNI